MPAYERINESIDVLEKTQNKQILRKLDNRLLRRLSIRFDEFSDECSECRAMLKDMDLYLKKLNDRDAEIDKDFLKDHFKRKSKYVAHLNKNHELIQMGQNTGLWMSLGVSIGVVLGLTTFDNLAIGIPIGMSIGLLIGSAKDALAKKQDKVI
ncbi:hypothetical protein [Gudongella sp. SC589]|jgi:F0F1-type ATP synthase assembly protein I|uniref:hypothetical protein n=1 Tax=Gudongella sp. SC589 TaxID=3385990 RepID=UPI0039048E17